MKDLPHHMQKLNRRIIRSENRILETEIELAEEQQVSAETPSTERPREQIRKQTKIHIRQETRAHTPEHDNVEERNRQMKNRVPIFDRLSHPRPKMGGKSKKKTPPI